MCGLSKKITKRSSSIDRQASQTMLAVKPEQAVKTSGHVCTGSWGAFYNYLYR